MNRSPRNALLLILLLAAAPALFGETPTATALFASFVQRLTPGDLAAGSCVKNATDFYALLMDHNLSDKTTRIVLLVREPNRGMPKPMRPNHRFLRGEKPNFWIWHAFVVHQGRVYDPNYVGAQDDPGTYFKQFWSSDPNLDSFWVFAVPLRDFPAIAGSSYPGGPPRMLQFKPIDWQASSRHPDHTSVRK